MTPPPTDRSSSTYALNPAHLSVASSARSASRAATELQQSCNMDPAHLSVARARSAAASAGGGARPLSHGPSRLSRGASQTPAAELQQLQQGCYRPSRLSRGASQTPRPVSREPSETPRPLSHAPDRGETPRQPRAEDELLKLVLMRMQLTADAGTYADVCERVRMCADVCCLRRMSC